MPMRALLSTYSAPPSAFTYLLALYDSSLPSHFHRKPSTSIWGFFVRTIQDVIFGSIRTDSLTHDGE